MSPFHVVFCGTPDFAVPALLALAKDERFVVDAVITQPDKPVGRKQELTPPPVKIAAQALNIPVLQPESINTLDLPSVAPQVDFLVVVAYGQLLKEPVLAWPRIAPVNVHASLLPRWRGASPLQHALLGGDTLSGVTVQRMVRALDAGPVLGKAEYTLDPRETFSSLHDALAKIGAVTLVETLALPLVETPQDEGQVTLCHKLKREDGIVDPTAMTAEEVDRKVRALTPWPGVTCEVRGHGVKLLRTRLEPHADCLELPCAQGSTLYVETLQEPGKKAMAVNEWLRGI